METLRNKSMTNVTSHLISMINDSSLNQLHNLNNDETSFFHHRRKLIALTWESVPKIVSVFIQDDVETISEEIAEFKRFLEENKLQIEWNTFEKASFVILIGTDGFNLHISSLFQCKDTPPILSLTPNRKGFISFLEFCSYGKVIPQILKGNCWLLPRCRLNVEYQSQDGHSTFCCLNDITVNRDHLSGPLLLNCSSCGFTFSQISGDGIIIATPTGSTAYNKASGGALVHPLLPVFMLTPICAMSLSARPIIFPQSADLTISIQQTEHKDIGQKAYIAFDGMNHQTLKIGEKLVITISNNYFNSIMLTKSIAEWPIQLANLMSWNERRHQKALPTPTVPVIET